MDVQRQILDMAGKATRMVELGVRCLVERDEQAGREALRADRDLDRLEMEIDRVAHGSLVTSHLADRALRQTVSAFKVTTDLERIGDESVKLAHAGLGLVFHHLLAERRSVGALAVPVLGMLRDAVVAYEFGRTDLARAVIDRDDDVDQAYRVLAGELRGRMTADLTAIERLVHVRFAAKCLERIADHATNLAEQAIFVATGEDVRHRHSTR